MSVAADRAPAGLAWWGSGGLLRREVAPQVGWLAIVIVVGFAVAWPIVQLQWRAFADGASAFPPQAVRGAAPDHGPHQDQQ